MLIWNHKQCRQLLDFAHLVPVSEPGLGVMAHVIKLDFGALYMCLGFLSKLFAVLLWKSDSCEKHHRPKGQWGPVSPEQVKTALCWKGHRKETSKRLFEALLEQVIGRNLCPVGFPGYQQERSLSVLQNRRNPRGLQRLAVTLPCTCISELRQEYPAAQV